MAYDPNVLRRAVDRLEGERHRRRVELDRLRDRAYGREPRLAQLDRQLQGTMAQLVAATLRQGGNPAQAVRTVKEKNLDLAAGAAVLLGAMGLARRWPWRTSLPVLCAETPAGGELRCAIA